MGPERTGDVAAIAQDVNEPRFGKAAEDFGDVPDVARRLLGPARLAGLLHAQRREFLDELRS
jgi:hypothetical protein